MLEAKTVRAIVVAGLLCAGCANSSVPTIASSASPSSSSPSSSSPSTLGAPASSDGVYPDVVAAVARRDDNGTWTFDVTLSSPYDSPERYADAWRVLGPDGVELGVRELAHDHANEQPFTRSLPGVEIPDGVTEVTIEGRDQINGWGGATQTVVLDG